MRVRERPPALRRQGKGEQAQVLVIAVIGLALLMGATGLAIDVGVATQQRRHAQVAADAAALAGAAVLPSTANAVSAATNQATLNGFTSGTDNVTVTIHTPPTSGRHSGDSHYVEAIVSKSVPTSFMHALTLDSISVRARAVASAAGGAPCGLYVLDPSSTSALSGTGSSGISVNGCIQVNSSANPAVKVTGSATIQGQGAVYVNGTCSAPSPGQISPPCTSATPASDPLASVPIPSGVSVPPSGQTGCSAPPVNCTFSNSTDHTISPGVYNKIDNTNTGDLTLSPGTYIITTELKNTNSGRLLGNGVLLYFACASAVPPYWTNCSASGEAGGSLQLTGPSGFNISAQTSGTYAGLLVFYDRHNTSVLSLTGSSQSYTTGTIYAADSTTTLTGSSSGANGSFASLLVTKKLSLTGSSAIPIDYNAGQNYSTGGAGTLEE